MKYSHYLALVGSVSAVHINQIDVPAACTYQKSEDGLSCDTLQNPCNEAFAKPVLEKCPDRKVEGGRRETPPSMLASKKVMPPCQW
jgi:hypothetical protein|tara:strand:+ start:142 stop:399 length:258 start_codon:yes stop_codon:yes gene_type:complete